MSRHLIILVGADKGGVGKTTVTRALDDYLQSKKIERRVFDSEHPAGDLNRFVPNAKVIDIMKVDDQMTVFDNMQGVTVVDIRAGMLTPTLNSLDRVGLLKDVRAGEVDLALFHVLGPSVASLREVADTAKAIGGGSRHYLVKNYVNDEGFKEWETDARFASVFEQAAENTITIPHLEGRANTEVQRVGGSFDTFAHEGVYSRILRGYVRAWLDDTFREFDRAHISEGR